MWRFSSCERGALGTIYFSADQEGEGERQREREMGGGGGCRERDIRIGWVKLDGSMYDEKTNKSFPEVMRRHLEECASLSSIFSRGGVGRRKERQSAVAPSPTSLPIVAAYTPARGTYAYDVLHRRFKELDVDNRGYISERELKMALKGLNLPASEEGIQEFLAKLEDTTCTRPITFENFAEYAILQENKLVDTFKGLDKRKTGYITINDMKTALQEYKFRLVDKDMKRTVSKFHVRGGTSMSGGFYQDGGVLDFAEFREILMLSSIKDLRDPSRIWERAFVDLGDVDVSFPLSPGTDRKMRQQDQQRPKQQVLRHLLAAAFSAAVSRSVVAPLERIKMLYMVNPSFTREGFSLTCSKLWREEGVGGLFRGNLLNLLRIAPTKIVEYLVYENLQEVLKKNEKLDVGGNEHMLLGSLATMSGTFISHPIDTVRTVLTVQVDGAQRGIVESTKAIVKYKGFLGFYKGIVPNMMRVASYAAINFVVYDEVRRWYLRKNGPGGELDLLPSVCCGVLAGAAAQIAVYPLETVQRRLQAQAAQQSLMVYQNMVDAFRIIIQDEGMAALYSGVLPNTIKLVPAAAVSFLVYEALQTKLELKKWASK